MLVTNCRLADGRLVDLRLVDGVIAEVGRLHAGDEPVVDVGEWLTLPPMAEPHAHLDKALTAELAPNPTGDLQGAIDAWSAASDGGVFGHDEMVGRIGRALDQLVANGVTVVRSHVNVGEHAGLWHLAAAREAVRRHSGVVDVELVALTHSPMVGPEGETNRASLAAAVDAGSDLVGGCPHFEPDGRGSIDAALDIAADLPIDFHCDETLDPTVLTVCDLARAVTERGIEQSVTASHCVSLGMQTPDVQERIAGELAAAGVSVVTLPSTNLFLQGRDHTVATPRGLTAIHALRAAGVIVAAGGDNVQDPFNLIGRFDPLETAALLVLAGHVLPDQAYDMVSNDVRRVLGRPAVRFEVGDPADFVCIDTPSIRTAIAEAPADRLTFQAGRLVASSTSNRTVHR
ncbi:MAG: amidohydrolase family protein [Ilumatobacter sp.]|nr:amidohydrolase family protein [Ilumatobacter sp.]